MNQRVMLTKRLIKEAILHLLEKKDIRHVTVKEICSVAGINRSTFYAYYGCPQDVLLAIEKDTAEDIVAIGPCTAPEEIREHMEKVCEYLYENRKTQKIIMRNTSDEDLAAALTSSAFSVCVPGSYLIDADSKDAVDLDFAYTFVSFGVYHVIRKWILQDIPKTPAQIAEVMGNMLMKTCK